jgi:hypothetical protein
MAGANSSRPRRGTARLGGDRPRTHPSPRSTPSKPPRKAVGPTEWLIAQLHLLALRLEVIYGTAASVEMALRYQNAENDTDLAECIRHAACSPIWTQAEKAHALVERVRSAHAGRLPATLDKRGGSGSKGLGEANTQFDRLGTRGAKAPGGAS